MTNSNKMKIREKVSMASSVLYYRANVKYSFMYIQTLSSVDRKRVKRNGSHKSNVQKKKNNPKTLMTDWNFTIWNRNYLTSNFFCITARWVLNSVSCTINCFWWLAFKVSKSLSRADFFSSSASSVTCLMQASCRWKQKDSENNATRKKNNEC